MRIHRLSIPRSPRPLDQPGCHAQPRATIKGRLSAILAFTFLSLLLACGGSVPVSDDAGRIDAGAGRDANDAGIVVPDAAVDPAGGEVTSGGFHLESANYRLDLQFGHAFDQAGADGSETSLRGAAPVNQ